MLRIDSATGNYLFTSCEAGFSLYGTVVIKIKACKTVLNHTASNRNISVKIKSCKCKPTASINEMSSVRNFSLSDGRTDDSVCVCQ